MHYELLYPSKYLKASDLRGRDVTLTICPERGVRIDKVARQGGAKEPKAVMFFAECAAKAKKEEAEEKALILNKTNAKTIAAIYGTETEDWKGKRITLYPTKTDFGRDRVDCIRIRDEIPKE